MIHNGKYLDGTRHHAIGPSVIAARSSVCGCGCRGKDPQHRPEYARNVLNVTVFDELRTEDTRPYGRVLCVADGIVKIPSYDEPVRVVFVASEVGGSWRPSGWAVAW